MRRLWVVLVALAGCKPEAGPPVSIVTAPKLLALAGQPAEAAPGDAVTLSALVASPDGSSMAPLDWSFCLQPKPLTTNDVVSPACLTIDQVMYLTYAMPSVSTTVPSSACSLFGPDLPPSTAGQPDRAPVVPDATGGYYQPYRADLADAFSIGLERIRCNLAGASMDVAEQFRATYTLNRNPTIASLTLEGAPLDGAQVAAGTHVTFEVAWPDDAAETYPILDVGTQTLIAHREAMRVSWFATDGSFDDERSGRASDDPVLTSDDGWTAPQAPGTVYVWVVLRDDRGGVAWLPAASVTVAP
jgi:hypothetical protein